MSSNNILGIVLVVIGVVLLLTGGSQFLDVRDAQQQASAIGSLFGDTSGDLMQGLGINDAFDEARNKAIMLILLGCASVGGGALLSKNGRNSSLS